MSKSYVLYIVCRKTTRRFGNISGIKGILPKHTIFDSEKTCVTAIDGLPVKVRLWKNYNNPIKLLPGKHVVQIANDQGTLFVKVAFEPNLQNQKKYIARGEVLDRENIRMWIEDSEENKATKTLVVPRIDSGVGGGFF